MEDKQATYLRSLLDDFETGRLSDKKLDARLSTLAPEHLGWLATEAIRRAHSVGRFQKRFGGVRSPFLTLETLIRSAEEKPWFTVKHKSMVRNGLSRNERRLVVSKAS